MLKKQIILGALALLALFSLVPADIVEEIVAIVIGDVITLADYKAQFDMTVQMLRQQLSGESGTGNGARLRQALHRRDA